MTAAESSDYLERTYPKVREIRDRGLISLLPGYLRHGIARHVDSITIALSLPSFG